MFIRSLNPAGGPPRDVATAINQLIRRTDVGAITFVFDGGGSAITTGLKRDCYVTYDCNIVGCVMLADQTGSMVVDLWKDSYDNYPPTIADTITASAKPTISSAVKSTDTVLTGWTTSISAGDIIRPNVDSCSGIEAATLVLLVSR